MKRRDFLQTMMLATGGAMLKPMWWPHLAQAQSQLGSKILVMVVFQGGNDGINTVIPYTDGLYTANRPTLAIPQNQILTLNDDIGLHPSLSPLMSHWDAGNLAVIQGVGYPNMNLSHFRGTDIMFSGSSSETVWSSGWLARYLELLNPDFPEVLPPEPLALQQGFSARLPLSGDRGTTGVIVDDPDTFFALVNAGFTPSPDDVTTGFAGDDEFGFIRQVDVESFEYADVIENAASLGNATGNYPAVPIGNQLSTIATLIEGNLPTPIYLAAFNGFDTHANQQGNHDTLLDYFARSVDAFLQDMDRIGRKEDVVILSVSEFGRRVGENGSFGTDHGTAAPWFLIGDGVEGGLHGKQPPLDNLDPFGNLLVQEDYRSIYANLLSDWFGATSAQTSAIFEGNFSDLSLIQSLSRARPSVSPTLTQLHNPKPNPGRGTRSLSFDLAQDGLVDLSVFDVRGRRVAQIMRETRAAGSHQLSWTPNSSLSRGIYFLKLNAGGRETTQKLVLN
ncbi:MAG: DUF1501 domain-containing protein [Candidatus Eisenbacteria bacterium]|uniref:DUF1501 domain-containing protein n=1 Tax=Eiseniibacteriota bacterium TaxID=2212470 RepID=A0A7Y2EBE7_UNCEI|nr:DUF1501 domain-containing protein [Candidatus Eisenbacteria bacterium]